MFRMWGKIWKDSRMLRDTVVEEESDDTRTHKIFRALEEICYEFDLGKPIWLDSTIQEFSGTAKPDFIRTALSKRCLRLPGNSGAGGIKKATDRSCQSRSGRWLFRRQIRTPEMRSAPVFWYTGGYYEKIYQYV